MNARRTTWIEEDIKRLKGQEESLRLEYKGGGLFDKPESSWVAALSREVSAFANTEGGILVLGLREEKVGKTRVASDPDGVPGDLGRDQLQRKIEGNIFPYLPGIRVHRIPMASLEERVVFVLDVPQGTTAYQANDGKYYGRSELESKYLPDHEIRVRMARGKVARALLAFRLLRVDLATAIYAEKRNKHGAALEVFASNSGVATEKHPEVLLELMEARLTPDVVRFELIVRNDGELTIRDPAVEFLGSWSSDGLGNISPSADILRREMAGEVIYPGDERLVPSSTREFRCKQNQPIAPNDYFCEWRVFLDNAPPSSGELDLGHFLQISRANATSAPER